MDNNQHYMTDEYGDSMMDSDGDNKRPPGGSGGAAVGVGGGEDRPSPSVPGEWHPLRAIFSAV